MIFSRTVENRRNRTNSYKFAIGFCQKEGGRVIGHATACVCLRLIRVRHQVGKQGVDIPSEVNATILGDVVASRWLPIIASRR
jgi:hypothetical protein